MIRYYLRRHLSPFQPASCCPPRPHTNSPRLGDLLPLVHRESSRSLVDQQQQPAHDAQRLEEVVPQEVPCRVTRVRRPEIVDEEIEDGEEQDEERGRPTGLEAYGDHDAGSQAKDGNKDAEERPLPLKNEAEEEEDEEHTSCEL